MAQKHCEIRIGTSGWHYDHWKGRFYPQKLPKTKWFEYYSKHFDTVELNNTFYQLPKDKTLKNWHDNAPEGFIYTVKANRYITHIKRLLDTADPVERFFEAIQLLSEKLGPILYQLPPNFKKDLDRLETFIRLLPRAHQGFFEFRHNSWYSDDTYDLLDRNGFGFCIHDLGGVETERVITGAKIYLRFHGTTGRYSGKYSAAMLQDWADWIDRQRKEARHIYAYFNNDINAYAIENAKTLRQLITQ